MGEQIICCYDCEHAFDAMDERAFVPTKGPDSLPLCPLCFAMLRSSQDWAVWNDCNGVFETHCRRSEAQAAIRERYGDGETVVPVRVIVEPADTRHMREWQENELERRRA